MVELADIFRLHGPDYRAKFGDRMLPSHLRAMHDNECSPQQAAGYLNPKTRNPQNSSIWIS